MKMDLIYMYISLLMALALSAIMIMLSFVLGDKSPDKEKVSVYECGFDPFHSPGEPFSMSFFLMAMLFLIFDLEISYLFPWSNSTSIIELKGQMMIMVFMIVLVAGLVYEWVKGGLDWE